MEQIATATPTTQSSNRMERLPRWSLLIAIASVVVLFALFWFYHTLLDDVYEDAYISFRYAANLAHGNGLVFNPGEYVEGYTNFLWTLTAAVIIALGLDPAIVATFLNIGFALGLLALIVWFGGRMVVWGRLTAGWQSVAAFTVAASSPIAFAMVSGLETVLFTLLLTAAAFSFVLERQGEARLPLSSVLFAIAALTRPEGVLFWGLTVLYQLITTRRINRQLVWMVGSFLVIWLPYIAWRLNYYGYLLPNTFYNKATNGLAQVWYGLGYELGTATAFFGPVAFILALVTLWRLGKLGPLERYFALLASVNLLYIIVAGGDYMEGSRFFLTTFPLLSLLLAEVLAPLYQRLMQWRGQSITTVALLAIIFIVVDLYSCIATEDVEVLIADGYFSRNAGQVIDWLRTNSQPGDILAIDTNGKIPYYSDLYTIDMLGLTDAHIAHDGIQMPNFIPGHNKTDPAYIISRNPTYIMIYRTPETDSGPAATLLPGSTMMVRDAQFNSDYVRVATFLLRDGVAGWIYKHK